MQGGYENVGWPQHQNLERKDSTATLAADWALSACLLCTVHACLLESVVTEQ